MIPIWRLLSTDSKINKKHLKNKSTFLRSSIVLLKYIQNNPLMLKKIHCA